MVVCAITIEDHVILYRNVFFSLPFLCHLRGTYRALHGSSERYSVHKHTQIYTDNNLHRIRILINWHTLYRIICLQRSSFARHTQISIANILHSHSYLNTVTLDVLSVDVPAVRPLHYYSCIYRQTATGTGQWTKWCIFDSNLWWWWWLMSWQIVAGGLEVSPNRAFTLCASGSVTCVLSI